MDVQGSRWEGVIGSGDGSAARFATVTICSVVDKEVFDGNLGAVDQEIEGVLDMRSPGTFQVSQL